MAHEAYVVNFVDEDGVSNALVFDEPVHGRGYPRVLKINDSTGAPSYESKDDGTDIENKESPDGDYSDLNTYGVTWHTKK